MTVVVALAELLAEFGSGVELETVAVLVNAPSGALKFTVVSIEIVTDWPGVSVPSEKVSVFVLALKLPLSVSELYVTVEGRGSETVTFAAFEGPLLVMTSV